MEMKAATLAILSSVFLRIQIKFHVHSSALLARFEVTKSKHSGTGIAVKIPIAQIAPTNTFSEETQL